MRELYAFDINCLSNGFRELMVYKEVLGLQRINNRLIPIDSGNFKHQTEKQTDCIFMIWVTAGQCSLVHGNTKTRLGCNDLFTMIHAEAITVNHVSSDFDAKIMIAEKDYLESCVANKLVNYIFYYLFMKFQVHTSLTTEQIRILDNSYSILEEGLKEDTNMFYDELVKIKLASFVLQISNLFLGKENYNLFHLCNRKEEIVIKFIDMLRKHYKQQHEVAFYADKLFISPQYLTTTIKEVTGRTTNKWIDEILVAEAKRMLTQSGDTIQQIADQLNFADQSTFGKFFKKYSGSSPAEFRNRLRNNKELMICFR